MLKLWSLNTIIITFIPIWNVLYDSAMVTTIPANSDIVSVHLNNLSWMEICDILRRAISMLTYIYITVQMSVD